MTATAPNMALNLAPFSRWTLRDKPAQRWRSIIYFAFNAFTNRFSDATQAINASDEVELPPCWKLLEAAR